MKHNREAGLVHPLLIATIVLGVLTVGLGGFSMWAYINYQDQKNNVDATVATAVAEAKKVQSDEDAATFAEREKQPTRELVGPSDLGRVTVSYPKTWSVYVDKDGKGGVYEAYLSKGSVPPIEGGAPYALRITVNGQKYATTIASYQEKVKNGHLKASTVTLQGQTGTRLDGTFSPDVKGSMVIFKVRDKTLKVFTESPNFQADYNKIILPSLDFNV